MALLAEPHKRAFERNCQLYELIGFRGRELALQTLDL